MKEGGGPNIRYGDLASLQTPNLDELDNYKESIFFKKENSVFGQPNNEQVLKFFFVNFL